MQQATGFYTTGEVARLARIKLGTLYEWQRRKIAVPTLRFELDGHVERGYSYADLTILRILRSLRENQIDFDSASRALLHLCERLGPPSTGWSDAHVYFVGNRIYAEKPDGWPLTSATDGGQTVLENLLGEFSEDLQNLEDDWALVVPQDFRHYVMINPSVMSGFPVVRRTRIPTETIRRIYQGGTAVNEIMEMYPSVEPVFLTKAIAYEEYLDSQAAAA